MKKKYEDGVYDLSNDEYHAAEGLSRSALVEFKRSPLHYKHRYLDDAAKIATPAMVMGNLIHTLVLEPHKLHDDFAIRPDVNRRTNDGKFQYNQFTATIAGRTEVGLEDVKTAEAIRDSVLEHPLAAPLLADCKVEQSIFFTHEETGLQCKSRPDAWKNTIVLDLKSTENASYKAFQQAAWTHGYFLQAAMAAQALRSLDIELTKFIFIAAEKKPPHAVGIYLLDRATIETTMIQYNCLMKAFKSYKDKDHYPSYAPKALELPSYAKFDEYFD